MAAKIGYFLFANLEFIELLTSATKNTSEEENTFSCENSGLHMMISNTGCSRVKDGIEPGWNNVTFHILDQYS